MVKNSKDYLAEMLQAHDLDVFLPQLVYLLNNRVNALVVTGELLKEDIAVLGEATQDLAQDVVDYGRDVLTILQAVLDYNTILRKKKQN